MPQLLHMHSCFLTNDEYTIAEHLWLTGPTMEGMIPTEIGAFSIIESFGLAHMSLQGPLPSEVGLLLTLGESGVLYLRSY